MDNLSILKRSFTQTIRLQNDYLIVRIIFNMSKMVCDIDDFAKMSA